MTSLSGVTRNWGDPAKIIQKPNGWRIENAQGFNSYWFKHVTTNNARVLYLLASGCQFIIIEFEWKLCLCACACSKRQQIGMAVGVSLGCIVLLGVIAVPVVYMRRQWARAEENKLRLTARMSGLDESEVRSEVGTRHS